MKNLLLVTILILTMSSLRYEDLFPLAATALRRLEKLTSVNKKIF